MQSKNLFVLSFFIAFINFFFFRSVGFFGFQLFLIGTWIFVCALAINKQRFHKHMPIFVGSGLSILLSIILGLSRSNDFTHFLLGLNSLFFLSLTFYTYISIHPHLFSLIEVLIHPLLNLKTYLFSVGEVLNWSNKKKMAEMHTPASSNEQNHTSAEWKKVRPILGGLLLAAPIAFLLISLFSQADPVFGSLVKNIVGQTFLENMLWRVILSVICFGIGLPLLIMERKEGFMSPLNRLDRWSLVIEYSVVMSVIAFVIGAFLFVQWQYIFIPPVSGINLAQFGVATYSEYVNKGFNELLTATVFIFGLIWLGLLLIRRKPKHEIQFLRSVQFVVLIEFVVVVLSVFRRIWLYQHYHGMSLIRFYGGYFLVFLLAMTVTLFLRHLYNYRFVIIEIGIIGVSVFGLSFINVESYIVDHPPTVNERVDYVYLSRMSADGGRGWKRSFTWVQQVLDKPYADSSIISIDDRRQIAYAGITLEQLLSRYQELVFDVGTDQDIKQYYQTVLDDMMRQEESTQKQLESLLPVIQALPENQQVLKTYEQYHTDILSVKDKIQQTKATVDSDHYSKTPTLIEPQTPVSNWYNQHSNGKVNFDFNTCGYWYMCTAYQYSVNDPPNTFFIIRILDNTQQLEKRVTLDRILSWNPSEKVTYQDVKDSISIRELLRLQSKYFALAHRISLQPDGQRDYDADISLKTPFLRPVNAPSN